MAGVSERMKKHVLMLLRLRKILWTANEWSKDTVKARKLAYHEEIKELPREKNNARNAGDEGRTLDNLKTTLSGRRQGQMKKVSKPLDREQLKNRIKAIVRVGYEKW